MFDFFKYSIPEDINEILNKLWMDDSIKVGIWNYHSSDKFFNTKYSNFFEDDKVLRNVKTILFRLNHNKMTGLNIIDYEQEYKLFWNKNNAIIEHNKNWIREMLCNKDDLPIKIDEYLINFEILDCLYNYIEPEFVTKLYTDMIRKVLKNPNRRNVQIVSHNVIKKNILYASMYIPLDKFNPKIYDMLYSLYDKLGIHGLINPMEYYNSYPEETLKYILKYYDTGGQLKPGNNGFPGYPGVPELLRLRQLNKQLSEGLYI